MATLEDSESSIRENPISAPMHMPGAGIDDVLAGRVEQGVVEPDGSLVPRRPDQISSPAQAQRPRLESTCTERQPLPASPLSSFSSVAPPSCASTVLEYSSPEF